MRQSLIEYIGSMTNQTPLNQHLFPPLEPSQTGFLPVSPLHTIYFEVSGNPRGLPVVFLHGGPGAGTSPENRRFFDPKQYKIILMDQRGSGKSTPHAELRENTTWDLVSDLETLRDHLKISNWIVFGGSWGSTLALAYAIRHPASIKALVLRGIFLCRPIDIQWFYQQGASLLFPEAWEPYSNSIPEDERKDFVSAYYRRLTSSDKETQMKFAKIWSVWEAATSKLIPDIQFMEKFAEDFFALAFARIECHYFINKVFFPTDNYILENADVFKSIPGHIVHGRYDVVCPIDNAFQLHKAWPNSKLHVIPDAGHNVFERGISERLVQITQQLSTTEI